MSTKAHPNPDVETHDPSRVPLALSANAQTLFFEDVGVFANSSNGILSFTLTESRHLPDGQGGVISAQVVVGFLRCGIKSAEVLQQAISKAVFLARPTSTVTN